MLEIVELVSNPAAHDRCFAFTGQNAVVSMSYSPEEPWKRADLERDFGPLLVEVPIGRWQGEACYAVEIAPDQSDPLRHIEGSLFTLLGRVSDATFTAYGRALQMLSWSRDHRFCGRCGQATELADSGRALACSRCNHNCYPRLSPCVIVAVSRGDQLLLAAAKGRRATFYSTLAGFIEPGETAEEAVIREVREEVGLEVGNLRYFGSQPWPFPGQLMLGFYAEYAGGDLVLAPDEIDDAGWFGQHNLPPIPPRASISGQLIHCFFE